MRVDPQEILEMSSKKQSQEMKKLAEDQVWQGQMQRQLSGHSLWPGGPCQNAWVVSVSSLCPGFLIIHVAVSLPL